MRRVTGELHSVESAAPTASHYGPLVAAMGVFSPPSSISPAHTLTPVATEGNDFLFGTPNDDTYHGLGGDDYFTGSAGADHLDGGDGRDTVSYENASGGVYADLIDGGAYGDADGDTYASIENLRGSHYGDTLLGNAADNEIAGNNGDDFIYGRDGNDRLSGDAGNDILRGDDGADQLFGGEGDDLLHGGNGADTFHFNYSGNGSDFVLDFAHGIDAIDLHIRSSAHVPSGDRLFGTDFTLARGSIIDVPIFGEMLSHDNFDSTDWLFFNEDTHQLIALDRSQSSLLDRVTHGQVLATFANDVILTEADFV